MEEHVVKPIFSQEQPQKTSNPIEEPSIKKEEEIIKEKEGLEDHREDKKSPWDREMPISDPYFKSDPLFFKVADYLGMNERIADLNKNKIIDIINWGRNESPTKDDVDVLLRIKDVETRIGKSPGFSERRYAILHRYIFLQKQKSNVEKEMSVWEGGNSV